MVILEQSKDINQELTHEVYFILKISRMCIGMVCDQQKEKEPGIGEGLCSFLKQMGVMCTWVGKTGKVYFVACLAFGLSGMATFG